MTNLRQSASQPRVIERWFPCAEVSAASRSGWGSSGSETRLMTWFAKRPLAQSRAAVLCSLLPWPDDVDAQERVQAVIREALGACQDPEWFTCGRAECTSPDCTTKAHKREQSRAHAYGIVDCARKDSSGGYNAARTDVLRLLREAYPDRPAQMLDPFTGRGLIPLEAARFGQQAHAIDYSPVATLASRLLIDWPFRDWSDEPEVPYAPPDAQTRSFDPTDPLRLLHDVELIQQEVQRRLELELSEYYPPGDSGTRPWGYLWVQVIPCDACGRAFPLYGSNKLRLPAVDGGDKGCSFEVHTSNQTWTISIVDGISAQLPTMRARGEKGKLAWCPYSDCMHAHKLPEHKRLVSEQFNDLTLIVVAEADGGFKSYRLPTPADLEGPEAARARLYDLAVNGFPARPDEQPLTGTDRIGGVIYGAKNFGDLSVDRQNLLHATIAKCIAEISQELLSAAVSPEYVRALAGYAGATLVRKLRNSTRGAALYVKQNALGDIFVSESAVGFNYDSFETGIASGPGTWSTKIGAPSFIGDLRSVGGRAGVVQRGSALALPYLSGAMDAVVTDPPYEMMITYSDASDLFYVWLKRALAGIDPDFSMTANPKGTQEKAEEIIVHKHYGAVPGEHRTPKFYKEGIARAFSECRRVVHENGVVTIVFGHGDPEAWRSLLDAVSEAGLVLTGAWPANTEKGGQAGSANIQTTLTLVCRPAPVDRPNGRVSKVDAEMRQLIAHRVRDVWNPSGLSYVDQKMAAAGPALEVVGRYAMILDKGGQPVDLTRYLPLARQAVTEAHDLHFDTLPLDTFDQKTRFALEWVRSFGRQVQAASEARWNRLAADMEEADVEGVLVDVAKGVRLSLSNEVKVAVAEGTSLFQVALAAAAAWREGSLVDAATVIRACGVEADDPHFWACLSALSKNLPETDFDGSVWTAMVRNRDALATGIVNVEAAAAAVVDQQREAKRATAMNPELFENLNSLFGQEGDSQ